MERFFLDIVGTLIPGLLLIEAGWVLAIRYGFVRGRIPVVSPGVEWWLELAIAYVVGHGLTKVSTATMSRIAAVVERLPRKSDQKQKEGEKQEDGKTQPRLSRLVVTKTVLERDIATRPDYRYVKDIVTEILGEEPHFHSLRSIALTWSTPEEHALVHRFMFLSLLSQNTAVTLFLAAVTLIAGGVAKGPCTDESWRYRCYLGLALRVQGVRISQASDVATFLDCAGALNLFQGSLGGGLGRSLACEFHPSAGGHRTDWRDRVMQAVSGPEYLDPSKHRLSEPAAYTAWDLQAIRSCDVVFAFLETTNPAGHGLALEVGYGLASGKHVIFVDEKSTNDPSSARYMAIVRSAATVTFERLDDALRYLSELARIPM